MIRTLCEFAAIRSMSLLDFMGPRIRSSLGTTVTRLILYVAFLLSVTGVLASQDALARAHLKLDSGNVKGAIAELENYRQAHPAEADVYNLLGIAYARAGDDGRSLDMFKLFARRAPNLPQAYNNLGAAYLRKQDAEQAEVAFRHALRLSPQDVNALYNLGALLNARHKYAESRPLLERALQQEHSAQIAYETAVAAAGAGKRKDALRVLNSMSPPPGVKAVPWLRLAGTLNFDEGNIDAASKSLEEATRLAPDDEQSLYALALVRLKQNQSDRAIPLLETALSSIPPESRLVREGTLLAKYGAYDQALAKFEQATRIDPSSYDALYNLAVLRLEHFKDANGARDAAQAALAVKSTGEIHDVLGDICEAQSHYIDALNHYQEAVRLDPNSDKFAFDLGAELLLHENYDAARTVFHAAEKRFPKASRIYLGLGTAEFMRGKTADAVDAFL
jgi:tetratricopeptide (TPR) repeat protein